MQARPDALPFPKATFDAVVMTGMAHHVDEGTRARLFEDVHRCLRPHGRLVLVEETFAEESGCGPTVEPSLQQFGSDFDALGRADRLDFLRFTDWWGNRVMKGSDEIPLPMTFLTIEQWRSTLHAAGLPVVKVEQFGLLSGGGHLATPRAMLVSARQ